jgi:hypothetical protein
MAASAARVGTKLAPAAKVSDGTVHLRSEVDENFLRNG